MAQRSGEVPTQPHGAGPVCETAHEVGRRSSALAEGSVQLAEVDADGGEAGEGHLSHGDGHLGTVARVRGVPARLLEGAHQGLG